MSIINEINHPVFVNVPALNDRSDHIILQLLREQQCSRSQASGVGRLPERWRAQGAVDQHKTAPPTQAHRNWRGRGVYKMHFSLQALLTALRGPASSHTMKPMTGSTNMNRDQRILAPIETGLWITLNIAQTSRMRTMSPRTPLISNPIYLSFLFTAGEAIS